MPTSPPITSFLPALLWQHFDKIRCIPRSSKKEQNIARYIKEWARSNSFTAIEDSSGCLLIQVPPTDSGAFAPRITIQSHLDMVCEKTTESNHNFDRDPIQLYLHDEWLSARDTTLGADNGIGVAASLALAEDPSIIHGPLDLLFTVDEETGLTGASTLDPHLLRGSVLINLDSEEEHSAYIGCAGGATVRTTLRIERDVFPTDQYYPLSLTVTGLPGGHSGLDIAKHSGNAIKVAVNILNEARRLGHDFYIVDITGGGKHNAIPRDCRVLLATISKDSLPLHHICETFLESYRQYLSPFARDSISISVSSPSLSPIPPLTASSSATTLHFLAALPHGPSDLSLDIPTLIETSSNLASVATSSSNLLATVSLRSSAPHSLNEKLTQLSSLCQLCGADFTTDSSYPGWTPNAASPIVARAKTLYKQRYSRTLTLKAIHAGLECGLLLAKQPQMDAISIGPQIEGAHTPFERVHIPSVRHFYDFLSALIASYADTP